MVALSHTMSWMMLIWITYKSASRLYIPSIWNSVSNYSHKLQDAASADGTSNSIATPRELQAENHLYY